jgi:protein-L-isoaspartate(D-aspartate) O-methyltransferase
MFKFRHMASSRKAPRVAGYALLLATVFGSLQAAAQPDDQFQAERQAMLREIESVIDRTAARTNRAAFSDPVMNAMASVPRHEFVPPNMRDKAYENRPLPIGNGQTISQPYIVALMTDMLGTKPEHRVLEIGTGSGYQAAILAQLVDHVYSIEIVEELGNTSKQVLSKLGYDNVSTRVADGYNGWPEHAPFDSIIVTAAISHIPPPLVRQLKKGGRMLIPVGTRFQTQHLTLVEKGSNGEITTRQILPVYFVPFTGGH